MQEIYPKQPVTVYHIFVSPAIISWIKIVEDNNHILTDALPKHYKKHMDRLREI